MRDPEIMQLVKNILAEISKLAPGPALNFASRLIPPFNVVTAQNTLAVPHPMWLR